MNTQQYRLKSNPDVVVEAVQLTMDNKAEIATWCGGRDVEEIDAENSDQKYAGVNVPTIEGMKRASQQDWVVRRVWDADPEDTTVPFNLGFYPYKPGNFAEQFEAL